MSLDTNKAFKEEARQRQNKPIFLYTIYDYDGVGSNKYFVAHDKNIIFDGIDYIGLFGYLEDRSTKRLNGERTKKGLQVISSLPFCIKSSIFPSAQPETHSCYASAAQPYRHTRRTCHHLLFPV